MRTPATTPIDRREIVSWCLYDFANSSYSAVIVATIFAKYFTQAIVGNEAGLGDVWWGRVSSASMLFVALSSPYLGGIADSAGFRKPLFIIYTWLAVGSVAAFTALEPGMVMTGFALAMLANIGIEGAAVFYNSYLPRIAPPERQGSVSGWGYAVGYAGSIASLAASLRFTDPLRPAAIWLMVAGHLALFSLPAFRWLPADQRSGQGLGAAAREGLRATRDMLATLWRRPNARRFLLAYLLYEDGVNTVIVFSSVFAAQTLRFADRELILLYVLTQLAALVGAVVMARPTDTRGPKFVVVLSLVLWCAVVTAAFFVQSQGQFWVVAVVAGLGLGSVQAASRAFYSSFVPKGQESRYFGVYALVGKSAAVLGPVLFGEMSRAFGSQRPAILSIAVLYLGGLAILSGVQPERRET